MKNENHKGWTRLLCSAAAGLLLVPAITAASDLGDSPESDAWAAAQFSGDGHWREVDRIEGVWNVKVTITRCDAAGRPTDIPVPNVPAFDAMGMFAANGTFHDTNASNPSLRSSGFGYWRRIGHRTYQFAFKFFRYDAPNLMPLGPQVVRHTVELAKDGKSYTSRGTAEWFDANNNPAPPFRTCSTSTATRFR
jgi:hypothetical protein